MDAIGKFYAEKILAAQGEADKAVVAPPPLLQVAAPPQAQAGAAISPAQVNALTPSVASKFTWDTAEGVRAEVIDKDSHVAGEPTLRLTATRTGGRHAVAVRFGSVPRDRAYRVTLWVKGREGSRIMVEARDGVDPRTGQPAHYGVARFDLSSAKLVEGQGDIQNPAIAAEGDGWLRVSLDVKSDDGRVYALVGMLEGTNNHNIFNGAGTFQLNIGGIDINPM